jgi:hypothetical protein
MAVTARAAQAAGAAQNPAYRFASHFYGFIGPRVSSRNDSSGQTVT